MDYQKLMRKSPTAIVNDRALFFRWERGQLPIGMVWKAFLKNNKRDPDLEMGEDFEAYLNSLGYIRSKNG